jgi:hypothetical protein
MRLPPLDLAQHLPPNGAISATLDIGRPHRLQALCAATFIVLPLELRPSLLRMRLKE